MRLGRTVCAVASAVGLLAAAAGAVTNGTPDGNAHPYVGVASSGDFFCSGTLLSATVFLTAGHCTDAFASTGEPTYVTVDPNASRSSVYVTGTPYTEPGFFNIPPKGVGVPASVGHDLGVVVLDHPIVVATYGRLPSIGAASNQQPVTVVGYGAQDWVSGQGGRFPIFTFVRTRANATIVNDENANSGEFLRVSSSPGDGRGGIGPGDSGAPALLDGGPTIIATGSHGASPFGSGSTYSTRLDTAAAQAFIEPFLE